MTKHRRLAGGVPICLPTDGSGTKPSTLQVLLVSSRRHPNRLIFPKGGVKRGETPAEAAARETWEEAGVRGDILLQLGPFEESRSAAYFDDALFFYEDDVNVMTDGDRPIKRNSEEASKACRWFVIAVRETFDEWPERGERQRCWYTLEQARKLDNVAETAKDLLAALEEIYLGNDGELKVTNGPSPQAAPCNACTIA